MIIPQRYNFDGKSGRAMIVQGSTFDVGINYTDASNVAINLTGWNVRMKIRETFDGTVILSLTSGGGGITVTGATGRIDILITPTQTASIVVPEAVGAKETPVLKTFLYDLELENPAVSPAFVGRLLYGTITVSAEVTY